MFTGREQEQNVVGINECGDEVDRTYSLRNRKIKLCPLSEIEIRKLLQS